jgi:hypothetical protein
MRIRRLIVLAGVVASSAAAGGGLEAAAAPGAGCRHVHGVGVGQDLGGGNTVATITRAGLLNGTSAAAFTITGGAPPVLTFVGTITLTSRHGTVTAALSGTFDVAAGQFRASGPFTGGTGKFAGATGELMLEGLQNLATGAFTETLGGRLCLPTGHD